MIAGNFNETQQSAFRCGHSIEAALLQVKNVIMISIDQSKEVLLIFLDLSAAFDTVDRHVPFSRL